MTTQPGEVERILRERARALAQEPTSTAEHEARAEALVVRVGSARYAVPLATLSSVVALDGVTPLPGAPSFVSGLAQVHGHVITIVDLGVLLGEAPSPPTRALLVEVESEAFGLGIAAYETVLPLPSEGLSPAPPGLSDGAARYLEGLIPGSGVGLLRLPLIIGDLCRDDSGNGDENQ